MFVSSNGNVFSPKMLSSSHLFTLLQKKRSIVLCVISSSIITSLSDSLCYVSQDFSRSTQVSAIAREKTSEMLRLGAGTCPHFRKNGSLFQSFLYAFRRGARALAGCP